MKHVPNVLDRRPPQYDKARVVKVYQVTKLPDSPDEHEIVVAVTSKSSAARLIAGLADEGEAGRYRVTAFEHPELPFVTL